MQREEIQNTKEAFDAIAGNYDSYDNTNEILGWMRSAVHKIYLKNLKPGSKILELNSGTGVDAISLAENNMQVYATDISPKMISILMSNAKTQMSNGKIKADVKSFDEIENITENNFEAVVSNFGGLNCINDFSKLSDSLASKLNPAGKFIAVVMNKYTPWEMLYYLLRLDFKSAFRRLKKTAIYADLNGEKVLTWYYTPKEFAKHFSENFSVEKIYTLALYTPPPYLIGIYRKLKPLVKLWMAIDGLVKGIFPFNRFGDHFIIIFSLKG